MEDNEDYDDFERKATRVTSKRRVGKLELRDCKTNTITLKEKREEVQVRTI